MDSSLEIKSLKQLPDSNLYLYRYVTVDKLIDFLLNKRIPLTRLDLFEDKLEGITLEHLSINNLSKKIEDNIAPWAGKLTEMFITNVNPSERNSLRQEKINFQKSNYASCWFVNNHESVAMWQLYSKPDSIAIKIPVSAFIEKVQNKEFNLTGSLNIKLKYGLVQYYRLDDSESIIEINTPEERGFLKDKSYSHESEFRVLLETKKKTKKIAKEKQFVSYEQVEKVNKLIDQKILYLLFNDFNKLPFELIFHPQSSEWHRTNIIETISKFDLNFPLKESSLTKIFN